MSKFRIYNIQLLPNEKGIGEVGVAGYRRLFAKFRDVNEKNLREKTVSNFHMRLSGDAFLGPIDFRFPSGFVYGNFVRYTKADEVTELRTGKTLYRAIGKVAAVTTKKYIPFVFDTKTHYFAIDQANGGLPKAADFRKGLEKFLAEIALDAFPDHTLTVTLVSKTRALEHVFASAVAYKTVDVSMVFPNGHSTGLLLDQLRETKTQHLKIHASAGKKGRMSDIPEFLKTILRAANGLGQTHMTYFVAPPGSRNGETRRESFNSDDTPYTFEVRHSASDTKDFDFYARVASRLEGLDVADLDDSEDEGSSTSGLA